jgi:hypothetical protein
VLAGFVMSRFIKSTAGRSTQQHASPKHSQGADPAEHIGIVHPARSTIGEMPS